MEAEMAKVRLSQATADFLDARSSRLSASTMRGYAKSLATLLDQVGDMQVQSLHAGHMDKVLTYLERTRQPQSMKPTVTAFNEFFKWCRLRKLVPATFEVMGERSYNGRRNPTRLRVPAERFPEALEAAEHPRDRAVVALALYLFLRQSEISALRISHLNLADGEITVWLPKTREWDVMPISSELDYEMRRWLMWYRSEQARNGINGDLNPNWHLVPARSQGHWEGRRLEDGQHRFTSPLNYRGVKPIKPAAQLEHVAHRVLTAMGYETKDAAGKALHEGMHTWRRSGARAYFDARVAEGYDGALRQTQIMLHHKNAAMTEHYIGVELDKERRNRLLRGKPMFPPPSGDAVALPDNVVSLHSKEATA